MLEDKVETLKVGAKRSLTIPKRAGDLLSIAPGTRLEMRVRNGEIILTPIVEVPGRLPAAVRVKFLARRARTEPGLSLKEFSARMFANAAKVDALKATAQSGNTSAGAVAGEETQSAYASG